MERAKETTFTLFCAKAQKTGASMAKEEPKEEQSVLLWVSHFVQPNGVGVGNMLHGNTP